MFLKSLVAVLALSLFACAAEPTADEASTSSDIVHADPGVKDWEVAQETTSASAADVITVVAVAKVKPETRNDFAKAGADLVRGTRLEAGNVSYRMLESQTDAAEFIFIEEWESQDAIDAHMKGEVLGTFFNLVKDDFLPGYPQITELDTVPVAQKAPGTNVAR